MSSQEITISAQQSQIEDLYVALNEKNREIGRLEKIRAELSKEVESLQYRIVYWREDLNYNPQQVRISAIKEFADRLKPMYRVLCVDESDWCFEIDRLVKEMTEGINNGTE